MKKISDEIRSCVNNLYDLGYRGNSNSYRGMRVCDEEHLAGLIIQATPLIQLPALDDLDQNSVIINMMSRYLKHSTPELAQDIAEHLKELLVKHFQNYIQQLMDDAHYDSAEGEFEREQSRKDLDRDIHSFNKQRI